MGMQWPLAPAQQRKAVVAGGGGPALKLLLFVILTGLALRLLAGPAANLLLPIAAPDEAARLVMAPGRGSTGGGATPPSGERFLESLRAFLPLSFFLLQQERHAAVLSHGELIWLDILL
jgi:hypothetical protein